MTDALAGRYELGRELGRGGMAQVREAVDQRLGRRLALKLLPAGTRDGLRARFLREARLAAQFTHRNAVMVYDVGEDRGTLYLAMELIDGPSLAGVLARRGPLEPSEAVVIADQVLAAVGAAHDAGLIHRDIKPSNILFTTEGVAKLADFGIAKSTSELQISLTSTGEMIGTPQYLSPEQAAGQDATPASDLYAVGVVLFEMLTGAPPYRGDTALATALAHQQAPIPSLRERRPDLDRDLAAVVRRALAKSPERRYSDAAAMRTALAAPWSAASTEPGTEPSGAATSGAATSTATRPLDTAAASPEADHTPWTSRSVVLASLAVLAAVVVGGILLWGGDGGSDGEAGGQTAATPSTTTSTTEPTTTTTTTAAPPTTEEPPTIGTLTDVLMGNLESYGEKAEDLLDKMQKVQGEDDDKRSEEAEKVIDEIDKWVDEGELDPEIADRATRALDAVG